jgi:hypothetical protein
MNSSTDRDKKRLKKKENKPNEYKVVSVSGHWATFQSQIIKL